MSRGFVLRNPATCCASVETGSVSTASNTTCPATPASYTRLLHLPATTIPASPASTISSYNRFLAFSMTAPPPEKSISGGYRPAGLRRAPESARLPAGCCLCVRNLLDGIHELSVIWTSSMEGSVILYRTIHDMALQRGRFASGR